MKITLWSIVWLSGKFENLFFHQHFLNMDISLNRQQKLLKFCFCVPYYHIEGSVSQIFYLGLSFCFMKSRKLSFKS